MSCRTSGEVKKKTPACQPKLLQKKKEQMKGDFFSQPKRRRRCLTAVGNVARNCSKTGAASPIGLVCPTSHPSTCQKKEWNGILDSPESPDETLKHPIPS
jgi:hypothetical protein